MPGKRCSCPRGVTEASLCPVTSESPCSGFLYLLAYTFSTFKDRPPGASRAGGVIKKCHRKICGQESSTRNLHSAQTPAGMWLVFSSEPPSCLLPSSDCGWRDRGSMCQRVYYLHQVSGTDPIPGIPVRVRMKAVTALPIGHWCYWEHPLKCEESWESAISSGLDGPQLSLCLLPCWVGFGLCGLALLSHLGEVQSGGSAARDKGTLLKVEWSMQDV